MPDRGEASIAPEPRGSDARPAAAVRVLFLYDHLGYPGGVTHGLTRYCLSVLPQLNVAPIAMTACFLRQAHPAADALIAAGVPTHFLGRAKWDPRALVDVLALIRRQRIDIVHAAGQKGILVGRTAARIAGARSIIHLHDLYPLGPAIGLALRATAGWTDLALGISDAVCRFAGEAYRLPPDRCHALYNGIDAPAFAADPSRGAAWRARVGIPSGARAVGIIGRLAAVKGHARLIRQLARIRARIPQAVVAVIGDGEERGRLHSLAERLGLAGAVYFAGQQDDMAAVLAGLDAVAIPSDHEGLSYVALEAWAAGRPVVAADVGGLAEIIRDGETGMLFPLGEEDLLGDRLVAVLGDPAATAAMARRAQHALARFTMDDHVRRLREHYVRLAAGGDGRP
jgi:glycosyltransferase involved in cell wall biosynthesis